MICRLLDLRNKEVVNICNGECLGNVCDIEFDTCCANIISLIIYGRPKLFGLLGKEDDIIIKWQNIQCIGEDAILVNCVCKPKYDAKKHCGLFDRLLR